jgi:hypothetical protein
MVVVFRRSVLRGDCFESWQFDDEPRSTIMRIVRSQATAVLLYDALTQIQPEAQSSRSLIAMRLHKAIEDLVAPLDRHAAAVITNSENGVARAGYAQTDLDRRVVGAELERVVDQVRQHLLHAQRVQLGLDSAGRVDRDETFRVHGTRQIHHVHDELAQVGVHAINGEVARVRTRGVHESLDHARESNGLPVNPRQGNAHLIGLHCASALVLSKQQLRNTAQRGGRRPQLVGRDRQGFVHLVQLLLERLVAVGVGDHYAHPMADLRRDLDRGRLIPIRGVARQHDGAKRLRCVGQRRANNRTRPEMRKIHRVPATHLARCTPRSDR